MAPKSTGTYRDVEIESDIKLLSGSGNTADLAGIQFRKEHVNDDFTQSGYTVYVRENGGIELYKAG